MAAPRESWEEVGERLSELGLKLKLHVEQAEKGRPQAETEVENSLPRLRGASIAPQPVPR